MDFTPQLPRADVVITNLSENSNAVSDKTTNASDGGPAKCFEEVTRAKEETALFAKLIKFKIPLNSVKYCVEKLEEEKKNRDQGGSKEEIIEVIMRKKMKDARRRLRKALKKKNQVVKEVYAKHDDRKAKKILKEAERKARKILEMIRKKNKKKIKHLKETQAKARDDLKKKKKLPEKISDYKELFEEDEDDRDQHQHRGPRDQQVELDLNVPVIGTTISPAERALLAMPPKFCVLPSLKEEEMDLALEIMGAKVRYSFMGEGDREDEEELEITPEMEDRANLESARTRTPYDYVTKELDMRNRRATDVKGNARVIMPKAMTTKEESSLLVKVQELKKIYSMYAANNCTKEGKQRTNLTKQQEEGLKSLQKRSKEGEIVFIETDKSDKLAVVSMEVYLEMGEAHLKGDREVDQKEVTSIQAGTNGHVASWIKIMGVGECWDHTSRVRETTINKGDNVAPLYVLLKDHKPVVQGELPKTRPVCSSQQGLNYHLQNILSDVVEPLAEEVRGGIEVGSTEDLLHEVDQLNKWWMENKIGEDLGDVMILGCDAVSLFPNLKKEETARELFKEVVSSQVEVKGVSWKEMSRYIAINSTVEEQEEWQVADYVAKRRHTKGPVPGMTSKDVMREEKDCGLQWRLVSEEPGDETKRRMLGACLAIAVKYVFSSHLYTFGGKVMRQEDGGPIGLRLTCALAKLRMAVWARSFIKEAQEAGCRLYMAKGYEDDLRFWLDKLELGTRWTGQTLAWREEWEEEDIQEGVTRERVTARELNKLMNQVSGDIEMTVEIEEDFMDKHIPTLDTKMCIKYFKEEGVEVPQVVYSFFKKPTSSKLCMLETSAQPNTVQQSALCQEVIRRQLNCCSRTTVTERLEILKGFSSTLTRSGYSREQRNKIFEAGLMGYANKVERAKKFNFPLHRSTTANRGHRRLQKLVEKASWYKKKGTANEGDQGDKEGSGGSGGRGRRQSRLLEEVDRGHNNCPVCTKDKRRDPGQ